MTQAGLGQRLNYSDKSISKWERGEAIPDAFVLTQMAALFGVTVDYPLSHDGMGKSRRTRTKRSCRATVWTPLSR